ncbi:membrane-bound lytic murein transglycosylase MltF [Dongia mobilis]|uniref:Membrane-bound lytic murein transglycosylase MltF n=1 Tax=Dongia mobilis TaxID=578943 RepID=A0A4R6WXJ1_9PROT|nr:transporter substrate-binding domain-containing protein [Dongia mobilis]TDQ82315.1 membrane-bound lytic murein transglycosylase MltF [Dongia mobilis]
MRNWLLSLLLLLVLGAPTANADDTALPPAELSAAEEAEVDAIALPLPPPWTGDFDGMRERRLVRILVAHSKTLYFHDRGMERGIDAEYARAFEAWLNKKLKTKALKLRVALVPVPRDRLLSGLVDGIGDIAAGALTITPGRAAVVDFTDPVATNISELVVTGPKSPPLSSIDDLAGQTVPLRKSSSYYTHVRALSDRLVAAGKAPIKIQIMDEDLEDEGIMEMVNVGLLPLAVVDRYKGLFWAQVLTDLKVREDLVVNAGGNIAWAVRKDSPLLAAEINTFMQDHRVGTTFGNTVVKRYLKSTKALNNAYDKEALAQFRATVGLFRKYAGEYGFDHLMMVAQGFQESKLNQAARSPRGAVGIMQLLPSTAADPVVGITGIEEDAEKNIHAGIKYMSVLRAKYLDDPDLDERSRTLMTFAAYNAGPGNLRKFRRLADKEGRDPNRWFDNVEVAAAKIVGAETVQYVSNIYKYYVAYKLISDGAMQP